MTAAPLTVQESQLHASWSEYLTKYQRDAIVDALLSYPEKQSITIDFRELQVHDPDLANHLLDRPDAALRVAEAAVDEVDAPLEVRPRLRLRVSDLPPSARFLPGQLRVEQLGHCVAIRCLVDLARDPRPLFTEAAFECKFCANLVTVAQEDEALQEPVQCDACEKTGPWRLRPDYSRFIDQQAVTIQDPPDSLRSRDQPRNLEAVIRHELVDGLRPGDRVLLTCIADVRVRRKGNQRNTEADVELQVIHVERDEDELVDTHATPEQLRAYQEIADREDVHEALTACFAPGSHGMHEERLACLLSLAGSPRWDDGSGNPQRGTIHVLMCTDPGMNKSRLMRSFYRLAPLCVRVNGQDTTGAGLSASAERDDREGRWRIRAGALIRAHGGHCIIDELGLLADIHVGQLTTAMDPGEVIVTKAGLNRTYPAEVAVLAGMNPKKHKNHRFSPYSEMGEQIGLPAPILSRFDLIFCRNDRAVQEEDQAVFRAVTRGARPTRQEPLLGEDDLRRYIAHAQRQTPTLGAEATSYLERFFLELRPRGVDGTPGVDRRFIGVIVRLTLAAARLRFAPEATESDARTAGRIVMASLRSRGVLGNDGTLRLDLLQSGTDWSQEERLACLLELVRVLEDQDGRGYAREEDVLDRAREAGIPPGQAQKDLERLRRDNRLFAKGGGGTYAIL